MGVDVGDLLSRMGENLTLNATAEPHVDWPQSCLHWASYSRGNTFSLQLEPVGLDFPLVAAERILAATYIYPHTDVKGRPGRCYR